MVFILEIKLLLLGIILFIHNSLNPSSPDYMIFSGEYGKQPLVDTAFLEEDFIRIPKELWGELDKESEKRLLMK